MLRNFLRTSRYLVRQRINTTALSVAPKYSRVTSTIHNSVQLNRRFSSTPTDNSLNSEVDPAVFDDICNETLESLCECFEEVVESASNLNGADVTYSDGVLTVTLGANYGTYVINRQTPNKQIWLSSPVSGPKRYDLVLKDGGYWVYKHDGVTLHRLLQDEISKIVDNNIKFNKCAHSLI